jgi:hypothetical protein
VVAKAEVQRLLDASFIREVQYPTSLANIVMVKKKNDKWRMCTNFTDLNKCCPKDNFPLSRIWLCKEDEEKMGFITPFDTYCYLRMLEGLKNVGPIFCRMTKVIQRSDAQKCLHICL